MAGSPKPDRYSAWFHATLRDEGGVIDACMSDIASVADEVGIELPAHWFPVFDVWEDVGVIRDFHGKRVRGKWQYLATRVDYRDCPGVCIVFKNFQLNDSSGKGSVTWRSGRSTKALFERSGFTGAVDPSLAQQRALRAEHRRAKLAQAAADARAIKDRGHAMSAALAQEAWDAGLPADDHGYLVKKNVGVHGLRVASRDHTGVVIRKGEETTCTIKKGELLIPMYLGDQLMSLQRIFWGKVKDKKTGLLVPGWAKLYITGGRTEGCCFRFEGSELIAGVEGWATGASCFEETGCTVIVTFSAGNLPNFHDEVDLVMADNDASATGVRAAGDKPYLMPTEVGQDWNDVALAYPGAIARLIASLGEDTDEHFAALNEAMFRAQLRAPARMTLTAASLDALRGPFSPKSYCTLTSRARFLVERRKQTALGAVSVSDAVRRRHDCVKVGSVKTSHFTIRPGVTLLLAPHGSGKTERLGAELDGIGGKVGIIVHRRSLATDMAKRLRAEDYQTVPIEQVSSLDRLAVCLPSTCKEQINYEGDLVQVFMGFLRGCKVIFIDELWQLLEFIGSKDANGKDFLPNGVEWDDVWDELREIVRGAEYVIAADAGMNDWAVEFLESCRPGERFHIIEEPWGEQSVKVRYGFDDPCKMGCVVEILTRACQGKRSVVCSGEKETVKTLANMLRSSGLRVLAIHANSSGYDEVQRFLDDPATEALKYDVVAYSPSLGTGFSVVFPEGPVFDRCYCITSGSVVTPADLIQMVRRFRQCQELVFVLLRSGVRLDSRSEDLIVRGVDDYRSERGWKISRVGRHIARVKHLRTLYCRDGTAGLLWILEHMGYWPERFEVQSHSTTAWNVAQQEIAEEEVQAILAADDIDAFQAAAMRRGTDETVAMLDRYEIRSTLRKVSRESIEFWDGGRGIYRMRLLGLALGCQPANEHEAVVADALRRIYPEGVLAPGVPVTEKHAREVMERVLGSACLQLYIHLGIVPSSWSHLQADLMGVKRRDADRAGQIDVEKESVPVRRLGELYALLGLGFERSRVASPKNEISVPMSPFLLLTKWGDRDNFFVLADGDRQMVRARVVKLDDWLTSSRWLFTSLGVSASEMSARLDALRPALTLTRERSRARPAAALALDVLEPISMLTLMGDLFSGKKKDAARVWLKETFPSAPAGYREFRFRVGKQRKPTKGFSRLSASETRRFLEAHHGADVWLEVDPAATDPSSMVLACERALAASLAAIPWSDWVEVPADLPNLAELDAFALRHVFEERFLTRRTASGGYESELLSNRDLTSLIT